MQYQAEFMDTFVHNPAGNLWDVDDVSEFVRIRDRRVEYLYTHQLMAKGQQRAGDSGEN